MKSKENNLQKKRGFFRGRIHLAMDKLFDVTSSSLVYLRHKVIDLIVFVGQAKEKSKDLVGTNLALARTHFQNKNLLDAKIRYKVVLKLDKANFEAYFGLAYIYYVELKLERALMYFKKAEEFCADPEKRAELENIIGNIERHLRKDV